MTTQNSTGPRLGLDESTWPPPRSWSSQTVLLVVVALAIAGAAIAPFYFAQREISSRDEMLNVISYHDLVEHIVVMKQFDKVLRSGVIYPRWLPDINNGYGIAWGNFYPPGFYYLTSLAHAVVNNWLDAFFVVSVLLLAGSGLALYALARLFYGKLASAVAALLYMLLPFHLMNFYWQGAMPQFTGFVYLPLVVYFVCRVGNEGRKRHYAGLGFAYGLYVMTHLPVAFLMSYLLVFYAVIWAVSEKNWRVMLRIAGGMALGLVFSGIYWLPALLEARHAYEDVSGMFPYHSSYLLLLPPSDSFVAILNHAFAAQTTAMLISILLLRAVRAHHSNEAHRQTRLWMIVGIVATFMATSLSIYISKLLPKIEVAAFPWRWLAIASAFTALLFGGAVERLRIHEPVTRKKLWALGTTLGAIACLNVWLAVRYAVIEPISHPRVKSTVNFVETNYTPAGATPPTFLPDTPPVVIEPAGGVSEVGAWDPRHREVTVRIDQPSEVRLKTYNFPGWTARIDGQKVPLASDKDGVQVVSVPPGIHKIETDFVNTPPRTVGAIFFGLGFTIIACLTMVDYRRAHSRSTAEKGSGVSPAATDRRDTDLIVEQQRGKPGTNRKTKFVVIALVLAGVVVIVTITVSRWLGSRSTSLGNTPAAGAAAPSNATSGFNGVGSEVRLYVAGMSSIPVAVDETALNELMGALPMGNKDRVEELVESGRLFRVNNNTRVRVLEFGSARIKVRILEGESITMDGWVPERWIK